MAHRKKKNNQEPVVEQTQAPDKIDQLISLVWWLANELKNVKQELNEVKQMKQPAKEPDEIIEPAKPIERETPYKVIPIEKIVRDESFLDPNLQWVKKIYMWIWRTFKNKRDAVDYLERMKKTNPWMQYDIFPV